MTSSDDYTDADPERRLRRLLRRLPSRMQATTRWLRKPASRWARIPGRRTADHRRAPRHPAGFRPVDVSARPYALADDIPPLRRFRDRALDWLEWRRPAWFAAAGRATGTDTQGG